MKKKSEMLTVRIDQELYNTLDTLAKKDERTLAWMARKLMVEAMEARGLSNKQQFTKTKEFTSRIKS